jgi:probable F420-dependent oxidoreductase
MRFGIMGPIVSRNPRHDPPAWEAEGTIDDLVAVALAGERFGYDFLTFPEHVAIPNDVAPARGGTYWSPPPTMGYVAAHTTRLRLATYVLVLGYHHPLELIKTYGTLDRICGGRLILGVGVGSLEPEFGLLGVPFEGRGARADDALRAIRAAWGQTNPVYHGSHYDIEGFVVSPTGLDRIPPIWVGGRTRRSLRRAFDFGDAWSPFGLPTDVVLEHRAGVPESKSIDIVLAPEPPVDPLGDGPATLATVQRYAAAGATHLVFRFKQRSQTHLIEQMDALSRLCPEAML